MASLIGYVLCECGESKAIRSSHLKGGASKSCGCLARELRKIRATIHGCASDKNVTAEYRVWRGMINRTTNIKMDVYYLYGGRGISVCDRWRISFENFLADMGPRPSTKHSIDRWPDMNGNYEPGNCRWATLQQQGRNKRNNTRRFYNGKQMTLVDLSEVSGINYQTLRFRLKQGWDINRAMIAPAKERR